jgi:hypothetical protein
MEVVVLAMKLVRSGQDSRAPHHEISTQQIKPQHLAAAVSLKRAARDA